MALYGIQCVAGLALTGLLGALQAADGTQSAPLPFHGVRAAVPAVAALVAEGRERSSTFRALLQELDASEWIVFVQTGSCQVPGVSNCLLHRIGTFHGMRYLRVVLSERSQSDDEAIATIGHELQHAVEVANTPGVSAAGDIRELYRRIGYLAKRTPIGDLYETSGARSTGAAVLRELKSDRRVAGHSRRAAR